MVYPAEAGRPLAAENTPMDTLRISHLGRLALERPAATASVISRQKEIGHLYRDPTDAPMPLKSVLTVPPPPPVAAAETPVLSVSFSKPAAQTQSQTTFNTAGAKISMLPAAVRGTPVPGTAAMVYPAEADRLLVAENTPMDTLRVSHLGRLALERPAADASVISRQKEIADLKAVFPTTKSDLYSAPADAPLLTESTLETNLPPLPDPLSDNIVRALERLSQSISGDVNQEPVPILIKNITYRDKGLESEGTKHLSGLIRTEVTKYSRLHLLAPGDLTRPHHFKLEGELWDDSDKISIKLRIKEDNTNQILGSAEIDMAKQLLPSGLAVQPPRGKSLDIVAQVVAMMQQIFPPPADFQISVSPNKGLDAVYLEGESFTAAILTEKNAYLRVDFYQVDGKVIHILPNPYQSNSVRKGLPFFIGDPEGPYQFIVAEPFGQELLVVIASRDPIPMETGSTIEPARPYIRQLHQVLSVQKAKGVMAAAHYIIVTKKGLKGG
ncbi:MAG: DUF4384 domain-containing protein [Pseudomonadota bacterium]